MMFAEISDKMPTINEWWVKMFMLALPVFVISLLLPRRFLFVAWVLAGLQSLLIVFGSIQQAYFEGGFSEMVWGEMGGAWVFHNIVAAICPLILVALSHGLHVQFPKVWQQYESTKPEREHTEPLHIWR